MTSGSDHTHDEQEDHTGPGAPRPVDAGRSDVTEDLQALHRVQATVERFVRGRAGHSAEDSEDLVQETMARLLENRERLEPDSWEAYAVVSARNLLRDRERVRQVQRRHRHRLHAPDVSAGVEEQVLTEEEHAALRRALAALPDEDRSVLDERYGAEDVSARSVAPAAAARLARARGKLRVAYLLEHTGMGLPTERCRPVLEALSSGDRRRQERLGAGRHLTTCRTCATYAPVLVRRERALAALHPIGWVALLAGGAWAAVRRSRARTATAAVTAAGVVLAGTAVVVTADDRAPGGGRPPEVRSSADGSPASLTLVPGGPALLPRRDGAGAARGPVRAVRMPVQSVPADEGFWVGSGPGQRVWVQLVGGGESPVAVRAGDEVSFDGRSVPLPSGAAERMGLTAAEGVDELRETGAYVTVPRSALVVHRR